MNAENIYDLMSDNDRILINDLLKDAKAEKLKKAWEKGYVDLLYQEISNGKFPLLSKGLTIPEIFTLKAYTGSFSSWINSPLRDGYGEVSDTQLKFRALLV